MMNWRRYVTTSFLRWPFMIVITLWWLGITLASFSGGTFDWRGAVRETGDLAWYLLLFTIFISLARKLFPRNLVLGNLVALHKQSGILCFLIAGAHGLMQLLRMGLLGNPAIITNAFTTRYAMIFGTVSFLIMLPLFLTSTDYAMAHMGYRSWKNLQRFTHAAFIFAALHVALISYFYNGEIEPGPLVLLGVYIVGYAWVFGQKWLKKCA